MLPDRSNERMLSEFVRWLDSNYSAIYSELVNDEIIDEFLEQYRDYQYDDTSNT